MGGQNGSVRSAQQREITIVCWVTCLRQCLPQVRPDRLGAVLAGATLAHAKQIGAWVVAPGSAPVVFLGAGSLRESTAVGRLRFAIAHQLGHIVEAHLSDRHATGCTLLSTQSERPNDDEQFANAFAAYFLAPRSAVADWWEPPSDIKWQRDAACDVAQVFGMGMRSALTHMLNCTRAGSVEANVEEVTRQLDWSSRAAEIANAVESFWRADRQLIDDQIGVAPSLSVIDALRRPRSTKFEMLVKAAGAAQLVSDAVATALLAA